MPFARTVEEWEDILGDQVRRARIDADLRQQDLARLAGVSEVALRNLENGRGSSLTTLIRVVRALERTDWFEALAPSVTVRPLDALAQSQRGDQPHERRRVSRRTARR